MNAAIVKPELVPISKILRDPTLNSRANGVDESIAAEYAEAIANGARMPPIVLFREGDTLRLGDGWHRVKAAEIAGKAEILCEIRKGDERECRLFAVGANASHGARRTKADRWRAVEMLLRDPAWAVWSDREIAKQAAVDHKFVAPVRASLAATGEEPQLTERKGSDGKTRKVPKRKKGPKFNADRVTKLAIKSLEKIAKAWPAREPIAPLVSGLQTWIAERTANTIKIA